MRILRSSLLAAVAVAAALAQTPAQGPSAATLPTDRLLSEPGPTFLIADSELPNPLTLVAYGDQRFTDPTNTRQTNPRVRQWLVNQIAKEHPAAVIMNGDVPLAGQVANDYPVFASETKVWRDQGLRVFPTLGNHEFRGANAQKALDNWWDAFPAMRDRRWYSRPRCPC